MYIVQLCQIGNRLLTCHLKKLKEVFNQNFVLDLYQSSLSMSPTKLQFQNLHTNQISQLLLNDSNR